MAKRLGKLQAFLQKQKLDALLIKSKTMKKYMDTLTGSGCQILLMRDQGYLIVDGRYLIEANEQMCIRDSFKRKHGPNAYYGQGSSS